MPLCTTPGYATSNIFKNCLFFEVGNKLLLKELSSRRKASSGLRLKMFFLHRYHISISGPEFAFSSGSDNGSRSSAWPRLS